MFKEFSVSIIIPIYNAEDYIKECIESIFIQEYEGSIIECILVNDCTPDHSMEVVSKLLDDYHGSITFTIINHDSNKGHCTARNTGVACASGNYLLFVDSDDALTPNAIQCFHRSLSDISDSSSIDVLMGNAYSNLINSVIMPFKTSVPFAIDNFHEEALYELLGRKLFHSSWNKLIRRDFYLANELHFHDGIINEDFLWSYLVFRRLNRLLVIPQVTYIYNDNPISISRMVSYYACKTVKSRIEICSIIMDNPPSQIKQEYYTYLFFILIRALDIYDNHKKSVYMYVDDLFAVRDRLLETVRKHRFFVLSLLFLISVYPFRKVFKWRLFRRNYDRLFSFGIFLSKLLREPWL